MNDTKCHNNTSRMFPRTLLEAFPNDRAEYACAIESHKVHHDIPALAWIVLIVIGAVLAVAVVS